MLDMIQIEQMIPKTKICNERRNIYLQDWQEQQISQQLN